MSGGVDSSVAAARLVEQGWEVVGVTMTLLGRGETGFGCCGSPNDVDDAKRVCERLGVPHYTVDLSELFEDKVIKPFAREYLSARTPNPCVECNRSLKFGHLLCLAEAWGCEAVATGHYARVEDGRLLKAADPAKDQTYFLYSLTRDQLRRARFPVGELSKEQVRAEARRLGLRVADKPESQEICFVPRRDYRGVVEALAEPDAAALRPGPILDTEGREVGRHEGLVAFTVGQRKGLGAGFARARYVVALEPERRAVVVGEAKDVYSGSCLVEDVSWTADGPPPDGRVEARIRHRHPPAAATLSTLDGGSLRISFEAPQRAVTPGQAAVFYRGDEVLGGGVISRDMR
ncbi:MAG: tRNA 2-thiouridine(34) synthase MnmA [Elusimicrobia bacterium]|nr:tRNA 2-thiouridine(34) synthase MnmA [Elusimicrobiota bacterium]MDE2237759.1 tRNA 2-thiouridine(34) synthase MnmA [Elusimicrobiota bacterium]MDE2426153.1 tRNA 2-thiouridine(34) synthase MnmA [Elusimicrobiota bacterium]